MSEKLIDILDEYGNVIHTYPITLTEGRDADYFAKGLEAAASGQLVPDVKLSQLTARIHHSRAGRLAPYGDNIATNSQTKAGLEQEVRQQAYLLWEQEGRQEGRSEEYWQRALDKHLQERSYVLWQQEGSPEGHAEQNHRQIRQFESE